MQNLSVLGLGDVITLAFGIAIANALSLVVFVVLGLSAVPPGAGTVSTTVSFFSVVIALTILPVLFLFLLIFISSQSST